MAEGREGSKRRLYDLQKSCCVKRRNILESVFKAVGLAVELVYDAVVTLTLVADTVVDTRIHKLAGQ